MYYNICYCIVFQMELNIAFLANVTGDRATSVHFLEAAEARKEAMNAVFWNKEMGQWLDYWLSKGTQCKVVLHLKYITVCPMKTRRSIVFII